MNTLGLISLPSRWCRISCRHWAHRISLCAFTSLSSSESLKEVYWYRTAGRQWSKIHQDLSGSNAITSSSASERPFLHLWDPVFYLHELLLIGAIAASLDSHSLYVYNEYLPGGSVTTVARRYGAFEDSLLRLVIKQILKGLEYLHGKGICHGNLKGHNVLMTRTGSIRLTDYGTTTIGIGNLHKPIWLCIFWPMSFSRWAILDRSGMRSPKRQNYHQVRRVERWMCGNRVAHSSTPLAWTITWRGYHRSSYLDNLRKAVYWRSNRSCQIEFQSSQVAHPLVLKTFAARRSWPQPLVPYPLIYSATSGWTLD